MHGKGHSHCPLDKEASWVPRDQLSTNLLVSQFLMNYRQYSHELPQFPISWGETHPTSCPKVKENTQTHPNFFVTLIPSNDLKQFNKKRSVLWCHLFLPREPHLGCCFGQDTNEYMHTIHQLIDLGLSQVTDDDTSWVSPVSQFPENKKQKNSLCPCYSQQLLLQLYYRIWNSNFWRFEDENPHPGDANI